MNELDIDLICATLRPGETLSGVAHISGPGESLVHLTLQGEEVLGASNLSFQFVLPIFEMGTTVDCASGPAEFHFLLPEGLPPSYHSHDLRCVYLLKARRKGASPGLLPNLLPTMKRDAIHRMHVPVLPAPSEQTQSQHWFVLPAGGVELEVRLDSCQVEPGQSLTGELEIRKVSDGPLPRCLTFRFASIEESTQKGYPHRKVTSLQTHDITPEPELEYPMRGFFEFPIPLDAPSSGEWNTFCVHYGFRVGLTLSDGQQLRESLPIEVCRFPA